MTYDELQKKTAELYASGEVYTRLIFSATKQAVSRPRFAYVGKSKRHGSN